MVSYEESRKKRLEENRKRMEQLNLHQLSKSLLKSPNPNPKPKPSSPAKKVVVPTSPVRRSTRTAHKPPPNYKYTLESLVGGRRTYKRRDLVNRVYAAEEDRADAIERAQQLESTLTSNSPTFVKPMLQSHVSGGFWLSFPRCFCDSHMPARDVMVTLVDENGDQWDSKYLAAKNGLSGGWRGFSIDHDLLDGDSLVFQLTMPSTFKVYIVRVNSSQQYKDTDEIDNQEATNTTIASKGKKGSKTRN